MNRDEKDGVLEDSEYLVTVSGGRLFDEEGSKLTVAAVCIWSSGENDGLMTILT